MLLTIDIGNTNITLGVFDEDSLLFSSRIATDKNKMTDEYSSVLIDICKLYNVNPKNITGAIISSVVPEVTHTVKKAAEKLASYTAVLIDENTKTNLPIGFDKNVFVGSDLIAACVGALQIYSPPCFVIDLGTASKIMLIDHSGAFAGCTIMPGIGISLEALSLRTSHLPSISLITPERVIGTNTPECMTSGAVFGTASMIDGLTQRMESEYGRTINNIIATGGLAEEIVKNCHRNVIYNHDLILIGLKYIYSIN